MTKTFSTPIIGLHGASGSGKSELATTFRLLKPATVTLSLADPIKEFLHMVFEIPKENLWGEAHTRNLPLYSFREPRAWELARIRFNSFAQDWLTRINLNRFVSLTDWFDQAEYTSFSSATPSSTRDLCRSLGEDWGRGHDPYVWTRYLARRIDRHLSANRFGPSPFELIVVEDIRRAIDVDALNRWGGALIVVKRQNYHKSGPDHPSDADIYSPEVMNLAYSQFEQPVHDSWGASRTSFVRKFLASDLTSKSYGGECRSWEKHHGHSHS
jgi:hypothetical protein